MLPVQVIGQQWEFTYRYPTYGGVETAELVLPVGQRGRLPRHLARRRPLVLGLRARRQGGREPRRRQHRVRQAHEARHVPDPLRRALRALARLHVRHRSRRQHRRLQDVDRRRSARSSPASRSTCRSTARRTPPTRPSAPDERAPPLRVQPAVGRRARRRRLLRRLVARAPDQRAEHRVLRRHAPERHRALRRLPRRRGRIPRRSRLRELSRAAAARQAAVAAREGAAGSGPLLRPAAPITRWSASSTCSGSARSSSSAA